MSALLRRRAATLAWYSYVCFARLLMKGYEYGFRSDDIETLAPAAVAEQQKAGKLLLIDVREPAEFDVERIPGALLFPLSSFDPSALPTDGSRKVVFHCGSGKRSLAAAESWRDAGHADAAHMGGGIAAWICAGLPTFLGRPA